MPRIWRRCLPAALDRPALAPTGNASSKPRRRTWDTAISPTTTPSKPTSSLPRRITPCIKLAPVRLATKKCRISETEIGGEALDKHWHGKHQSLDAFLCVYNDPYISQSLHELAFNFDLTTRFFICFFDRCEKCGKEFDKFKWRMMLQVRRISSHNVR